MKPERLGDFSAIACAIVCGLGNIVVKVGLIDVSTILFNFWFFVAAVAISFLSLSNAKIRKEVFATDLKALGLIAFLTLFFSFGIYTFFHAIKIIDPATVSFLSRFEIILTIILAYFFLKERLTKYELLGGLIAVAGVFILKYRTTVEISTAASYMILSAFFFAVAEIMVKRYIRIIGTMRFVFFRNIFAVGIFYIILKVAGQSLTVPNSMTLLWAFIGALLLPVLGRVTYIEALKRINISRAALFTQSTPLFTVVFALMFLHSLPTPIEWLGGTLIISGVLIVKFAERVEHRKQRVL